MVKFFRLLFLIWTYNSILDCCFGKEDVDVAFFNVGQGNCTVIKAPDDNTVWIVDIGSNHNPLNIFDKKVFSRVAISKAILNWIGKELNKYDLKIVLSHPDDDHCNIINALSLYFPKNQIENKMKEAQFKSVELFISDKYEIGKYTKVDLEKYLKTVHEQKKISFEGMLVEIFSPNEVHSENNENSLVVKISYGRHSVLLTGDATEKTYKNIQKKQNLKDVSILQASHHGSKTDGSNSDELINLVNPSYVVFSAPKYSQFRHPDWNIVERFYKHLSTNAKKDKKFHFFYLNKNISPSDMEGDSCDFSKSIFAPIVSYRIKEEKCEFLDDQFYAIYLTNRNIFHTGSHGTIVFSWGKSSDDISVQTYDYDGDFLKETTDKILFTEGEVQKKLSDLLEREKNLDVFGLSLFDVDHNALQFLEQKVEVFKNLKFLDLSNSKTSFSIPDDLLFLLKFKKLSAVALKKNTSIEVKNESYVKFLYRFFNLEEK